MQVLIVSVVPDSNGALHSWLHIATYGLALGWLWFNWTIPSRWVLAPRSDAARPPAPGRARDPVRSRGACVPGGRVVDDHHGVERFGPPTYRRYEHDVSYSTAEYIDVLLTYSGHRMLGSDARANLLDCIADLIDTRYGGYITKRYLNELRLARRRAV